MALTSVESPPLVTLAGNPIWVIFSTDEYAENHIGIHLDPEIYVDAAWKSASSEMRYEPDGDHQAVVDFSKILQWDPEKEFSFPEKLETLIVKRNNLRRQWRLRSSQKYGNPLVEYNVSTSTAKYILPGKISDFKQGQYNDASTDWWTKLQAGKLFLTNSPRTKKTDAWSSERLYYLVYGGSVSSINLKIKINYTDGTATGFTKSTIGSVSQYDVYEIITSFSSLALYIVESSKVISTYEVWLSDQLNNVISEVMTYKVDHLRHPDSRYFIFSNAYKMYEGLRFTGKSSNEIGIDAVSVHRKLEKDYSATDRSILKEMISESHSVTTNSGWLTREEMDLYRELLLSREVYEIIDGLVIPIHITSDSSVINDDQSNLRSIQMRYNYAYNDSVPDIRDADEFALPADLLAVSGVYDFTLNTFEFLNGDISAVGVDLQYGIINVEISGASVLILKYDITNDSIPSGAFTDPMDVGIFVGTAQNGTFFKLGEFGSKKQGYCLIINSYPGTKRLGVYTAVGGAFYNAYGNFELRHATRKYLEYLYENPYGSVIKLY